MQIFTLPDGTTRAATDQFQIGDQKYPPGWLLTASASDLASAGIAVTTIADAVAPAQPQPAPVSVQVNSTSAPALDGVYPIDAASTAQITAETLYITETTMQGSGTFSNGQTTKVWPDASGTLHTFTTAQFIALAEGLARYVDSVIVAGQTAQASNQPPVWPTGPVVIP